MSDTTFQKFINRKIDTLKESNKKALIRYDNRLDRLRRRLQRLEDVVKIQRANIIRLNATVHPSGSLEEDL